jgi:methyl-accepting chemotaxis protein
MLRNFSIRTKLAVGFSALLIFSLLSSLIGYVKVNTTGEIAIAMYDQVLQSSDVTRTAQVAFNDIHRLLVYARTLPASDRSGLKKEHEGLHELVTSNLDVVTTLVEVPDLPDQIKTTKDALAAWDETAATILDGGDIEAETMAAQADEVKVNIDVAVEMVKAYGYEYSLATQDRIKLARLTTIVGAAVAFVMGVLFAVTLSRDALNGVRQAVSVGSKIAAGNLDLTVRINRRDEFGRLLRSLDFMRGEILSQKLKEKETERLAAEQRLAALRAMAETVEDRTARTVMDITGRTDQMIEGATAIADSVNHVHDSAQSVAYAADQALNSSETVNVATQGLSESILEIRKRLSDSTDTTRQAVEMSNAASSTMDSLSEAIDRIGQVLTLIHEIASQTNLLALNATIEAARAGAAGKGFGVVAQEVKNLANQTAKSTEEISDHIASIQNAKNAAVNAIGKVGRMIRDIDAITIAIFSDVDRQSDATGMITESVYQAADSAKEVSKLIKAVFEEMEQTRQHADSIRQTSLTTSQSISDEMVDLRQTLVQVVRAASHSAGHAGENEGRDETADAVANGAGTAVAQSEPFSAEEETSQASPLAAMAGDADAQDGDAVLAQVNDDAGETIASDPQREGASEKAADPVDKVSLAADAGAAPPDKATADEMAEFEGEKRQSTASSAEIAA